MYSSQPNLGVSPYREYQINFVNEETHRYSFENLNKVIKAGIGIIKNEKIMHASVKYTVTPGGFYHLCLKCQKEDFMKFKKDNNYKYRIIQSVGTREAIEELYVDFKCNVCKEQIIDIFNLKGCVPCANTALFHEKLIINYGIVFTTFKNF